ncbi:MAG TPA: hypothetical protein VEA19_01575 [Actinomycetota bacterium]|nr:hypothetical protein [Actinomycetota bacterium]
MLARRFVTAALAVLALAVTAPAGALPTPARAQKAAATGSFELVGHSPLENRGMNAALAVHGNYAYVGSRTDGKPLDNNLTRGGIMIVNISNPATPTVVGEMSVPNEGNQGESSRELRVWRSQDILIVLHTNCSNQIHICASASSQNSFRAYDISGAKATNPTLIREWQPTTHEFFLWEDPLNPERALIFNTSAGSTMAIFDISPLANGGAPIQLYSGNHQAGGGSVHSMSVSNDGTRGYYALLTGGFSVMDVSDFTSGAPNPALRRITLSTNRPTWSGPGAHSAVKLWKRDWVAVFDEVYGSALMALGDHGCPWGWGRMIDISDPTKPVVRAEYKIPENEASFCEPADTRPTATYSAHNPTLTPNIGFVSWHAGGLQAIDLTDPASPKKLAEFRPTPLPFVVTEDPVLTAGSLERAAMWSYPIIKDGLIYVTDIRNGLYILRYKGDLAAEADQVTFLEGNSNQGHALCFDPVLKPKENPEDPDEFLIPEYCDDRAPTP